LLSLPFFQNPEVSLKIKFIDLVFRIGSVYSGLGSENFSRERFNQLRDLMSSFISHSSETHIEKVKVPSLIDDYQIDANIYINKTFLKQNVKLPTIIFIHGGGWVIDYSDFLFYEKITAEGMVFIEIKYRLAPEYKFPIPIEDCFSALQSEILYKYSDRNKLALLGDSAGGNLVTALNLMLRDRRSPIFNGIKNNFVFYPSTLTLDKLPSHEKYENWYILTGKMMRYYKQTYIEKKEDWNNCYFNPLKAKSLDNLPEFYIVLSERDYLLSEGEELVEILKQNGVSVTLKRYQIEHGFLILEMDETNLAIHDVLSHLKKKKFY